jgi:hypothetical protein
MDRRARSAVVTGTILIVLGVFFLISRTVPGFLHTLSWPYFVIGVGGVLMAVALVTWSPGLAVPACIVGGIGGILLWQNQSGLWWTWSYAWTLIPGFVGVGVVVSELLEGRPVKAVVAGGWPILVSLVLFFLFGSLFGSLPWLGPWWAVVLIGIGVLVLLRPLVKHAQSREQDKHNEGRPERPEGEK